MVLLLLVYKVCAGIAITTNLTKPNHYTPPPASPPYVCVVYKQELKRQNDRITEFLSTCSQRHNYSSTDNTETWSLWGRFTKMTQHKMSHWFGVIKRQQEWIVNQTMTTTERRPGSQCYKILICIYDINEWQKNTSSVYQLQLCEKDHTLQITEQDGAQKHNMLRTYDI